MNNYNRVQNSQKIVNQFGFWPSFGDDEITSLGFERERRTLIIKINAIQYKEKNCEIEFTFTDVADLSIKDLNHQNVISSMDFTDTEDDCIQVSIEPAFGADITFKCKKATVNLT